MTFSEYIATLAVKQYIEYCKKNNIQPELDVEIPKPKLCALVMPKPKTKPKTKQNA